MTRWRGRLALLTLIGSLPLTGCLPREAGPRLRHFSDLAPGPGDQLPVAVAFDLEGRPVDLGRWIGRTPVVLQLGSHSCPVFRYSRHALRDVWAIYGERVAFLTLYTREAHPRGSPSPYTGEEWDLWINRLAGIRLGDPEQLEERAGQARWSSSRLALPTQILVDGMDDALWSALGRAPSSAFVLDREGRVVSRQVWVNPKEIRRVLDELLAAPES